MPVSQWRQFHFFDKELVVDAENTSSPPQWLQSIDITASASNVTILNHALAVVFSFQAYAKKVTHLKHMRTKNQLVSIGRRDAFMDPDALSITKDDEMGVPVIKVWNLEKADKAAKTPVLMRSSKIQHANKVFPVTAFAVLENMTQVALGLENGVVLLMRGDISRDRFTKSKVVHEGSEAITGLGFHEDGKNTTLYIVTLARILSCETSNKDATQVLDDQGADFGNAILTPQESHQEMVIGRKEAIYFYGLDGRGPCFIIDGEKTSMTWFRNYLAIVSREPPPNIRHSVVGDIEGEQSDSSAEQAVMSPSGFGDTLDGTVLTLYDLKNKYVAFTGTFNGEGLGARPQAINCVLGEWGELFVITEDKKMHRLEEKDLDTKLDILFKKNMYALAINLVTSPAQTSESAAEALPQTSSSEYDYGTVVEIYKRYGDWLYSKGDYDMAMQQYLRTVGQLEPSYVIRKFLDAQRIHNLTSYLQALHERGLAKADHTTLLLNCYTKLKDEKRLDTFVKGADDSKTSFDVETAIRVCRQGGYHDHALYLARRHDRHGWVLTILVEDLQRYKDAVDYISRLGVDEADDELSRYGTVLVREEPAETTDALVALCGVVGGPGPEDFIHLFVGRGEWCVQFLERVAERRWGEGKGKGKVGEEVETGLSRLDEDQREKEETSQRVVGNTLVELYLDNGDKSAANDGEVQDHAPSNPDRSKWQQKAMKLLQNEKMSFDLDHALVLCKMRRFTDGVLYLYNRMGLHKDILQHHMDASNHKEVIATCKKYGDKDPSLWTQALSYFAEKGTRTGDLLGDAGPPELLEVLDTIDKRNLLPPLQVVQVLARNSAVTIGMVREYLIRRIEAERKAVDESEKLIHSYREETERMRAQIDELKGSPIVFQATKCDLCRQPLELPTVHFMCKHSYHQRCLGESDHECPRCAPEHRAIQELIRGQEKNAGRHDVFLQKLESADDRFAVIADYFSKNTFVTVRPI
ncbi:Vacuolar protein sorting-associated protein 11 [Borealophlyctis nickersoniae]|nr:Vacuolar protein sorting-associated protein 11 [Borealophlyctis nickersoniae]